MSVVSNILIILVAALHVVFFVLERFLWSTPTGQKIFKLTAEQASQSATLAANQGVYNLLLALGLIWTLLATSADSSKSIQMFILTFIFICGIYGALTVGRSLFFLQSLPALFALISIIMVLAIPRMNDITTNFEEPTAFQTLKGKEYPRDFIALQKRFYPKISPIKTERSAANVFQKITDLIRSQSLWNIISENPNDLLIEATAKTRFLRFTDDIIIKVHRLDRGSVVHMRSRSRKGRSDFGVNAKRIFDFFSSLRVKLDE